MPARRNVRSKIIVIALTSYVPPNQIPPRTKRFSLHAVTMKTISASGASAPLARGKNASKRMSSIPPPQRISSGRMAYGQPGSRRGWRFIAHLREDMALAASVALWCRLAGSECPHSELFSATITLS